MSNFQRKMNIAIDGPAGAGKSTIARMVANELNYIYVDTGAMYRVVTWKALQLGYTSNDEASIIQIAETLNIRLCPGPSGQLVYADDLDVTAQIRSREVTKQVSQISQIPGVRKLLAEKQKEMAAAQGVVMDGRDIGTKVLPEAELKIFLTASVEERARRRLEEMRQSGTDITFEQLVQEIAERDRMDEQREASPLVRASDALLIDTTKMTIPQVVEHILNLCRTILGGAK